MDELSQVEMKYGIPLPPAYRSFADRGYLTHPGDSYLWVHEAEWLRASDMLKHGGFFGNPKPELLAFAFSGGRDLWAWQTQRISDAGEPMIVFCPRDCLEGWWHAPSFLGWLYRLSLEYACSLWEAESESRQNLRRWAAVLREFVKNKWADDIEDVAARPVKSTQAGRRPKDYQLSLISAGDVADRVASAFGDGFIDAPYMWDIEGEA